MGSNEELMLVMDRMRRDYLRLLDLVPHAEWRGSGHRSLPGFLAGLLRITPRKARQIVAHAEVVAETSMLTGKQARPQLPVARAAMERGTVGPEHLAAISQTVAAIPREWLAARQRTEQTLVSAAANASPHALLALGRRALVDLGLGQRSTAPLKPTNRLRYRIGKDGSISGRFEIARDTAQYLPAALDRMAADPTAANGKFGTRPPAERLGDALATMMRTAMTVGELHNKRNFPGSHRGPAAPKRRRSHKQRHTQFDHTFQETGPSRRTSTVGAPGAGNHRPRPKEVLGAQPA